MSQRIKLIILSSKSHNYLIDRIWKIQTNIGLSLMIKKVGENIYKRKDLLLLLIGFLRNSVRSM
jgi:hypothetical protein